MSNIFYYKYIPEDDEEDKCIFMVDVSNIKYITFNISHLVEKINITFKDDTNVDIETSNAEHVLDALYEFLHKYLSQKEAHEQYKPDGAGYMEAKSEFETLKNKN